MKICSRMLAGLLMIALVAPGIAQQPAPPAQEGTAEEMKPKFIWGLLLNIAFKLAMSAFSEWLANKITTDLADTSKLNKIMLTSANAAIVSLADAAPFGAKSAGAPENTVVGEPTKPITVENGRENYQGVHVAIVGFNRTGAVTGVQPVAAGFKSGDRIKLKVLPTFDGLLVIENITPKGERKQIYPAVGSQVVALKAGNEIMVPLGRNDYFEFAGATGDEQLVITIRDPRAFGGKESLVQVSRKDDRNGSSFVQELTPGTYPVISQTLKLQHGG
ncbi:MAG: hypothetical protein Q8L44_03930 [Sulfuritalea sp.]|jgi:hypothetical protein|nr:hypothetical protein [Sulfuritalea sp.]